jgi:hypothetical protein
MARRTEEHKERREPSRSKVRPSSEAKKRKPRGPLFRSGDPTLAERLEKEVYRSRR